MVQAAAKPAERERVEITLSPAQWRVSSSPARFRVLVAGRRFGKTYLAVAELLTAALGKPHSLCFYVAPTYRQAKQVAWKDLKRAAHPWATKINETDLSVELVNGSLIALRGADNPDSLRGVGLDFVAVDEYQDMDPDAWYEVLRPALSDRQGRAIFIGTPKGLNHLKDLFDFARDDSEWAAFTFTTLDGGMVPAEEIQRARAEMSDRQFRQEYGATFEAAEGRVYHCFDRAENMRDDVRDLGLDAPEPAKRPEVWVGMDFNVNPMSAVFAIKAADQLHVFDELELFNSNTEEMAQEIATRYKGRRVAVYPDPSGNSRKTSAPVGQTDFAILRRHGLDVRAPSAAPLVADRVNEVNALLLGGGGVRRLFIASRCKRLVQCLERLVYRDGANVPDKGQGYDHLTDALGYLVHFEFPIVPKHAGGVIKMYSGMMGRPNRG